MKLFFNEYIDFNYRLKSNYNWYLIFSFELIDHKILLQTTFHYRNEKLIKEKIEIILDKKLGQYLIK